MNSINIVGKGIMTEGSSLTQWKGKGRVRQIWVLVPVGWASGCVTLGGLPPHLSWPAFPLPDSERLLILHGVCSGSGVRLFVLSVKSLLVILEGM